MTLPTARTTLAAHEAAYAARQAHSVTLREHHARKPQAPTGDRPPRPTVARPTPAEVEAAQRIQADAQRAQGAAAARADALARATADVNAASARLTTATAEAERVKRLLAACRRAPGEVAAEQIAALGDMEGVVVAFAGEDRGQRDPYVTVSYQGVPFDALSGGQKVLVGLLLQRGMRRASGLLALPIVTDDAIALNAGAGPWPEVAGASIVLVTT